MMKLVKWLIPISLLAVVLVALGSNSKQSVATSDGLATYQSSCMLPKEQFYCSLAQKPWANVFNAYKEDLATEHDQFMQELFEMTGTDQKTFKACEVENCTLYKADEEKVCDEVIHQTHKSLGKKEASAITSFLNSCAITIPTMNIVATHEMGIAAATQSNLYIDDAKIVDKETGDLMPLGKAVLLHEVQHIVHDDNFHICVITCMLREWAGKNTEKIKQSNLFLTRFNKFREKRADMLAALVDPTYAKTLADFYQQDIAHGLGDTPCTDHPTSRERYVYLDNLYKEMVAYQV